MLYGPSVPDVKRSTILFAAFATISCVGRSIEIVVPDGFVGEARIVYDPQNGGQPDQSGFSYVFRIPTSGVLRVKDQSPFFRMHTESVRHEGGKKAKVRQAYAATGDPITRPDGSSFASTEMAGTTHVWVIESQ